MRTLVRELLRRVKPRSLVFIHDGLLISPEPSTVDLEACLIEASLGLHLVPPPHFMIRTHHQDPSLGELKCRPWLPLNPAPLRPVNLPPLHRRVKPCITFGPAALAQQCVCDRYQPLGSPLRYCLRLGACAAQCVTDSNCSQ